MQPAMRISAFTDILPEPFDAAVGILTGELGLRTIDLRSRIGEDSVDTMPLARADAIRAQVDRAGAAIGCVASWGVHGLGGGAEQRTEAYRGQMRERVEHLCGLAERLGTTHVRIYAMYRPADFDALPEAEQASLRQENADFLRALGDIAAGRDRRLVIENEPPTLAATTAELADLMARVNHPAVAINWDIVNGWRAGEYPWPAGYAFIRPHIACVHLKGAVADGQGRFAGFAVPGEDGFPHEQILLALLADGFDGVITIDPHYDQFADEHKLIDDPHPVQTVVARTAAFIEGVIASVTS
jgi:sugar phosphate isomerase/epimerase